MKYQVMKMWGKLLFIILLGGTIGCDLSADQSGILVFTHNTDFSVDQSGWQVDFTDFPASPKDSTCYELKWDYTDRPAYLGANLKSVMISGINHSDDLFMFMKRKVTGLSPNTDYNIGFDVELASNVPQNGVGVGGAPGESVYLKAGASAIEPRRVIEGSQYILNVDKGNQSTSGNSTIILGDISTTPNNKDYVLIRRSNASQNTAPFVVKSNAQGELWLIVGTDSGFEGTTTLYYTKVSAVFSTTN